MIRYTVLLTVLAAAIALPVRNLFAQTNDIATELRELVGGVNARIQAGARTEADLAKELAAFDAVLARHKAEKSDAVAQVLLMKGVLYLEVLNDNVKALEVFQQVRKDFPESQAAKNVEGAIAAIEKQEKAKQIQSTLVPGAKFPAFEEKDVDGKPLSLAKYKGKILLVDFWATWCMACLIELPNVIAAYKDYNPHGFEVVGISLDQDEQALRRFVKDKNVPWPQYFDGKGWDNKVAANYGVTALPATYLLDREGKIIASNLRGPALAEAVKKALGK